MLEKLKKLLAPDVGVGVKLISVSMFFAKLFAENADRLKAL